MQSSSRNFETLVPISISFPMQQQRMAINILQVNRVHRISRYILRLLQNRHNTHVETLGAGHRDRQWLVSFERQEAYFVITH